MQESQYEHIDVSVVVVNFNVQEYVANLFSSLYRASNGLRLEIFLIDNSSIDGSIPYLKERFPSVHYVRNKDNVGFGKANNQAIMQAKGDFTLIINPDTLVSEDTLHSCIQAMKKDPKIGALGCKILNADGSFAPESKRSFPSIWSSFCKASGLTALFPRSKRFGSYYMNALGEDDEGYIPVLSGAFMFFETALLQALGGFDERFFMYGEDIDLCKRVHEAGREIYYLPTTTIVHYKGESARQDDITYIRSFNQALYIYFDKHYSNSYLRIFGGAVRFAVFLKMIGAFLSLVVNHLRPLIVDLLLINLTLLVGYLIRYDISPDQLLEPSYARFLWTNFILSFSYSLISPQFGILSRNRYGVVARVKPLLLSYALLAMVSFFIKEIAFSRLILASSAIIDVILFTIIYTIRKSSSNTSEAVPGKLNTTRVFIVGYHQSQTSELIQRIRNQAGWNYEILGVIVQDSKTEGIPKLIEGVPVIGNSNQLKELIRAYRVHQLHYVMQAMQYKEILKLMTTIGSSEKVIQKIVPESMDYILGKSNVEYLEDVPVIDVELHYFKGLNPFLKRLTDLILWVPLWLSSFFLRNESSETQQFYEIPLDRHKTQSVTLLAPFEAHKRTNFNLLLSALRKGHISVVGAPITVQKAEMEFPYKRGLTGLIQINPNKGVTQSDIHRFDLFYLQNYSIWLDLDIMIKSLLRRPPIFEQIQQSIDKNI